MALVEVERVGKVFAAGRGSLAALTDVSFTVERGEVLGLLGANGAGKTTALRILSGYLAPSSGAARIAGLDVGADSLRARAQVGYLPEQVPLPPELRVVEYLRYRAELKGVAPRAQQAALESVLQAARLGDVARRIIGQLSKGYRQRVGLADALLGDPPVLLLDEPTDGLDPHQRREALDGIAALARDRAVILSTHVLPEVESICHRLVILARGRVKAQGTLAELRAQLHERGRVTLSCRLREPDGEPALQRALAAVPGVTDVALRPEADGAAEPLGRAAELTLAPGVDVREASEQLARAVLSAAELRELAPVRTDLEALFRTLTAAPGSAQGGPPHAA
ncbi:MAG: ABC transporter ATP-binding protein [Polyangia bacterium]